MKAVLSMSVYLVQAWPVTTYNVKVHGLLYQPLSGAFLGFTDHISLPTQVDF